MGVINMIPNIDIFFGGLSGKSHPILSRSAARGQGAGIHLRNSDYAWGGGEGRGGEEMEGRERQHVNEPAQCHWAPHRTAIWRIKDSYHLAASPTLYPHRIRIKQIVLCHNTPWPFGGGREKKKSGKTAFDIHEHGKRKQTFEIRPRSSSHRVLKSDFEMNMPMLVLLPNLIFTDSIFVVCPEITSALKTRVNTSDLQHVSELYIEKLWIYP